MKKLITLFAALFSYAAVFAAPTITGVTAQQRYPWNGKVDISYTVSESIPETYKTTLKVTAIDKVANKTYTATKIIGDSSFSAGTHKIVWDMSEQGITIKSASVEFNVSCDFEYVGVQLWEAGPYWAECNVGATTPEEYGYYFCWSGTKGYKRVGSKWVSLDNSETDHSFYSSYCPTFYFYSTSEFEAAGYIDAAGNLPAAHDAATACLGPSWRMPTMAECSDLVKNCDVKVSARNGVPGWLVVGRSAYASRSIFIPGAGYGLNKGLNYADSVISTSCMSSTPMIAHATHGAYMLHFTSQGVTLNSYDRSYGNSVRPVRVFVK